ncbi:MAG: class I mannose-6-phosphate isomerase [Acidimicrobiia bacterium]|nr:class I mannose-6-phosphate isomerase [Acidimicrobiia bacterium]
MSLGPFLLEPSLAPRVWGGRRLGAGIGEAWDLSTHPNGPATVRSGINAGHVLTEVVAADPEAFGGPLDLLAKRLDCAQNLSVQVHPTDGDAKTEAWVVLAAEPGAGVYLGFTREVTVDEVAARALDGSITEILAFTELSVGDAVFVPAGTVHAIGGGLSLFELQQASDTTYRLFDWGREGRELHLEAGLSCADLGPAPPTAPPIVVDEGDEGVERLVACPYFVIDRVAATAAAPVRVDPGQRWTAVLGVGGSAVVGDLAVGVGDTVVVPATAGATQLIGTDFVGLRYGPPPVDGAAPTPYL